MFEGVRRTCGAYVCNLYTWNGYVGSWVRGWMFSSVCETVTSDGIKRAHIRSMYAKRCTAAGYAGRIERLKGPRGSTYATSTATAANGYGARKQTDTRTLNLTWRCDAPGK